MFNKERPDEVFISYSRTNSDFVNRVVAIMKKNDIDPWIDRDDIAKGREWWREIQKGIARANAFVFVMSANSLRSQVCHWELAYAIGLSKKIVPVLYEDVFQNTALQAELLMLEWENPDGQVIKASDNWRKVAELNWIRYCDTGDVGACVQEVIQTARADFDYIDEHTRLLRRATEWEQKNRQHAFLLTGGEIRGAELWLIANRTKSPAPSRLHVEYIVESRAFAKRQRRRVQWVASVTILLLIVAGIIAIQQAQIAQEREQQREEQAQIAQQQGMLSLSRQLASHALSFQQEPSAYALGMLLGVASYQHADTYEARNALLTNLMMPHRPRCMAMALEDCPFDQYIAPFKTDFTNYPSYYAYYDEDYTIQAYRTQDNTPIGVPVTYHYVSSVEISPDGQVMAVANCLNGWYRGCGTPLVHLVDVATGHELGTIAPQNVVTSAYVWRMAFSHDNQTLAVATSHVSLWDMTTHQQIGNIEIADSGAPISLAFSPDGTYLAIGTGSVSEIPLDAVLYIWNLQTGKLYKTLHGHDFGVGNVEFSASGNQLLSTDSTHIFIWDINDVSVLRHDVLATHHPQVVAGAGGNVLAMVTARHVDVVTMNGQVLGTITTDADIQRVLIGGTGAYIVLDECLEWSSNVAGACATPRLRAIDVASGTTIIQQSNYAYAHSPNGNYLATDEGIYDLSQGYLYKQLPEHGNYHFLDDHSFAVANFAMGGSLAAWEMGDDFNDSNPVMMGVEEALPLGRGADYMYRVLQATINPTHTLLATWHGDSRLRLWDYGYLRQYPNFADRDDRPILLAKLAINASIEALAFSQDGQILALAGCHMRDNVCDVGVIYLLHASTYQFLGTPITFADITNINSMTFTTDGHELVLTGDNKVLTLLAHPDTWLAQTCKMVNRELTLEEWTTYLPNIAHRPLCDF